MRVSGYHHACLGLRTGGAGALYFKTTDEMLEELPTWGLKRPMRW